LNVYLTLWLTAIPPVFHVSRSAGHGADSKVGVMAMWRLPETGIAGQILGTWLSGSHAGVV